MPRKGVISSTGKGSRPSTRVCRTGLGPSPFCWKPQQLPPAHSGRAWPLSPGPRVANGDLPPLPPATPCFRLFQEDPKFWVQEPFHTLTLCWGPQRAHVWARFVSYTHLIRDENQEVKIYLFMNPLKTAGVNKSPESFLVIKSPYFPKQRTRE